MLQSEQLMPSVGSQSGTVEQNADGSTDIYFGPEAPDGKEHNWIQTVPGKGWFVDPAPLQPAPAVLRQELASERDRSRPSLATNVDRKEHHA